MKSRSKKIIEFMLVGVLIYLATLVYLYTFQRHYIYFPNYSRENPHTYGVQDMQVITAATPDGLSLTGWYKPPTDPKKPVIVLFHGNGGGIGWRAFKAREFMDHGYGFLLAEYRGYGGNPGNPTETGLYNDGRAYINYLLGHGINQAQIVLDGESLGTGVAVQMAIDYPHVSGLILESPYTTLPAIGALEMFYVPVQLLMIDRYDSFSKITKIRMPLLVVHGEQDQIVPFRFGKELYDAAPQPKTLAAIPNAGHNDLYDHGAADHILNFLKTLPREEK